MPASADYLTKYLTASNAGTSEAHADYQDGSSRPKKRRKKDKSRTDPSSLMIADDDDGLLLSSAKNRQKQDDDEDGPMVFETQVRSAEFRKKKQSNWQSLDENAGEGTVNGSGTVAAVQDEADKILADAAAESDQRQKDMELEDAPAVVETDQLADESEDRGPKMQSGARAGLQTAADTAALLAAEQESERREASKKKSRKSRSDGTEDARMEEETIYRDATGRRIDVSMRRAEVRAAEMEKQRREKKEREDAMGEVQRREKEERKKELDEAKFLTLGRSAEDEEMNDRLKEVIRWDDPMAEYIAQNRAEEELKSGKGRNRDVVSTTVKVRKKEYQGAAPPNRYGIKPGWRWDGVDRGNGFEKEWFQARGRKARNENLEYQWAMDE